MSDVDAKLVWYTVLVDSLEYEDFNTAVQYADRAREMFEIRFNEKDNPNDSSVST